MKTSIISNWRPLLRVFYPFLIAVAALWAMPRNASAQANGIEQRNLPSDIGNVSEYNASTGRVIDLFVVDAFAVARYDFKTGHPISVVEPVSLVLISAALLYIPSVFQPTGDTLFAGVWKQHPQ